MTMGEDATHMEMLDNWHVFPPLLGLLGGERGAGTAPKDGLAGQNMKYTILSSETT